MLSQIYIYNVKLKQRERREWKKTSKKVRKEKVILIQIKEGKRKKKRDWEN